MELLGVDVGGSGIKGAPVDVESGALRAKRYRIPTPKPATPDAVAAVIAKIARHFNWTGPLGCCIPARVKQGVARTASNIDDSWIDTRVVDLFSEAVGAPAVVMNDADAAGIAEMQFGAGRNAGGLVLLLTFGTGIGSTLFYDGVLVPNTELGHLYLRHDVHAERFAADSARKRERLSWEAWGERVQDYLDHLEFLLAPDVIILGGGVSRPHKLDRYFHALHTEASLRPAELQNEAGIIGAAYAARTLLEETASP